MKLLLNIFFISIIFIGCSKQNTITQPYTHVVSKKENKVVLSKSKNKFNTLKKSSSILEVFKDKKKIIILYSSNQIGHYAIEATNTSMVYMLNSNIDFEVKTIDIEDYSWESLKEGFATAQEMGGVNIIALLTNESYDDLIDVDNIDRFNIYLPLIHKNNVSKFKKILFLVV